VITADREEGAFLVASPQVDKISFTGGLQVAAAASERLARVTLELGGKSAAMLLDDAELSVTLPTLAAFSMGFSGQMYVAQSRVLVPKIRLDEMVDAFWSMITNLKIGDPWEADTHVGPVRNER
jgi:aldehyde dehydrogenase (NAD+)